MEPKAGAMFDSTGLRVLRRHECLKLLRTAQLGRIVYTDRAMPAIQPVPFALVQNWIVIRTVSGSKLSAAARNAVVAFEVDHFDAELNTGWSISILGHATELTDDAELALVRELGLRMWAPQQPDHFIKIDVEIISGRALPNGHGEISPKVVTTPASGE